MVYSTIFSLLFLTIISFGSEKSLNWSLIEVKADLSKEGNLRIQETQNIVFNGDWNGGERTFNFDNPNDFIFHSIKKISPSNNEIYLTKGSLDLVDNYFFTSDTTLRWRSRQIDDPIFNNTEIVYILDYTYLNVVKHFKENKFLLNHDFLFSDRIGTIDKFKLTISIDPIWKLEDNKLIFEAKDLMPGRGFVVIKELYFEGEYKVEKLQPIQSDYNLLFILIPIVFILIGIYLFSIRESKLGRFNEITNNLNIDKKFIEENLFKFKAEAVGFIWDDKSGISDLSAWIARQIQEKNIKLTYETESPLKTILSSDKFIRLQLLKDRNGYKGYERELIDGIFPKGFNIIDEYLLDEYYKSHRIIFNPISILEKGNENEITGGDLTKSDVLNWTLFPVILLFLSTLVFLLKSENNILNYHTSMLLLFVLFINIITSGYVSINYIRPLIGNTKKIISLTLLLCSTPVLIMLFKELFITNYILNKNSFYACLSMMCLSIILIIWFCSTLNSSARIKLRQKLIIIRKYFENELKSPNPNLDDRWYPYMIAFGLNEELDKWSKSIIYNKNLSNGDTDLSSSSSSSTSTSTGTWSGGGGSFSGGGATGSFASGISSFSLSSITSLGDSGGSSGGGGGGGW